MACGTGLQGAINIANKIALGQVESGIGGGVDTTSDAPIAVGDKLRKILLEVNRAKTTGQRLAALAKFRPAMLAPQTPTHGEPRTKMSMGQHCELRSEEHTSELQSLMRISYAVFCLTKKQKK